MPHRLEIRFCVAGEPFTAAELVFLNQHSVAINQYAVPQAKLTA
jgi:hypothetical protein